MERDEIFEKVQEALVDALAVDDDEVTPDATLMGDLGAESIDILDISFKLEQAFGFKIEQGELFPEGVATNPDYVQNGQITDHGIGELRAKLPHFDFAALERDRQIEKVAGLFTVNSLVTFVENKLQNA